MKTKKEILVEISFEIKECEERVLLKYQDRKARDNEEKERDPRGDLLKSIPCVSV